MAKAKAKLQSTTLLGFDLATLDGERWFLKSFDDRKSLGVFGTYTLQDWESIIQTLSPNKAKAKKRAIL